MRLVPDTEGGDHVVTALTFALLIILVLVTRR
jgi:hypothetical protein